MNGPLPTKNHYLIKNNKSLGDGRFYSLFVSNIVHELDPYFHIGVFSGIHSHSQSLIPLASYVAMHQLLNRKIDQYCWNKSKND